MKRFFVSLLLLSSLPLLANHVILDTCFFEDLHGYANDFTARDKGKFSGDLPAPWGDWFSEWSDSVATAREVNDGPERFLRIDVAKSSRGWVMFGANLEGLKAGQAYQLTVKCRNRSSGPVTVALRIQKPPYTYRWSAPLANDGAWQDRKFIFKLEGELTPRMGLTLNIPENGVVDMERIRLETSDLQPGEAAKINRPSVELRNFFRNSRLPLGLPSGWNEVRDPGSLVMSGEKGPSGEDTIKLISAPGKPYSVYSEPFNVADPKISNQVSFFTKAKGKWSARIMHQRQDLGWAPIPESKDWTRCKVVFMPDPAHDGYALVIEGRGELQADAFRAGPKGADAYVSGGECEVALALPPGELQRARIQFADEKPLLRYYVSGNWKDATLKLKVVNLYGESHDLAPVQLSGQTGLIDYLVFPDKPFGQFRVEACVERDGRIVSPYNELVVTRLARPVYWGKDAPSSPFGGWSMAKDNQLDMLKACGMNHGRIIGSNLGWDAVEQQDGKWIFDDEAVDCFRRRHLMVMGQLDGAPAWKSYRSKVKETFSDPRQKCNDLAFLPLSPDEFGDYARRVAEHFKDSIREYSIWGEAWRSNGFAVDYRRGEGYVSPKDPAAEFTKLTQAAQRGVKAVDPGIEIAGVYSTCSPVGRDWSKAVYDRGGVKGCKLLNFNFYTERLNGFPGDPCEEHFKNAFGYILRQEPNTMFKIIETEGQATSNGAGGPTDLRFSGFYHHTVPWDNREDYTDMADRSVRFVFRLLAEGVARQYLYSPHCYLYLGENPNHLSLLNADGYPHPILAAYSAMARRLEDKKYVGMATVAKDLYAYVFSDGRHSTAILSGKVPMREKVFCQLPNTSSADLYGNPLPNPLLYTRTVCYIQAPVDGETLLKAITRVK